jgi:hypothetical protein
MNRIMSPTEAYHHSHRRSLGATASAPNYLIASDHRRWRTLSNRQTRIHPPNRPSHHSSLLCSAELDILPSRDSIFVDGKAKRPTAPAVVSRPLFETVRHAGHTNKIVTEFVRRIHVDDVVLGGGQVKKLKNLPQWLPRRFQRQWNRSPS